MHTIRRVPLLSIAVTLGILAGSSCGGGSGPTAVPTPAPVAAGLDFTLVPMVNNATTVAFQWSGSATSYRLAIGRSSGAADVASVDVGPATSFTWSQVPVGMFYARVVPYRGTAAGTATSDLLVDSIDARQMIDALVFADGPLSVPGNPAGPLIADRMEGWPPGTPMTITLGADVPASVEASIQKTAAQIAPATHGLVQAVVAGRSADAQPSPNDFEVTISMGSPSDINDKCQCSNCVGCAWQWFRGSVIQRGRILVSTSAQPSTSAHEIGHVLGLAHITSPDGVRPPFTLGITPDGKYSPNGQLDQLDPATTRMLETIYGQGLTAGASRAQFEAAGLVPPASAAALAALARRPRGYRAWSDGNEIVVVKPACTQR